MEFAWNLDLDPHNFWRRWHVAGMEPIAGLGAGAGSGSAMDQSLPEDTVSETVGRSLAAPRHHADQREFQSLGGDAFGSSAYLLFFAQLSAGFSKLGGRDVCWRGSRRALVVGCRANFFFFVSFWHRCGCVYCGVLSSFFAQKWLTRPWP